MYSVAIIDDNPIVVESIKKSIDWEALGCEVFGTAENGIDALRLLTETKPGIVIIDIMMPGFTGFDVIGMLKETLPDTYYIVITGFSSIESARKSIRLGVFDYIVKPIANDDLMAVIRDCIADMEAKRDGARAASAADEKEEGIEREVLRIKARMPEYVPLIRKTLSYIDENVFQDLTLTTVASAMLISPGYLSNLFKKETGKSFLDYVTITKLCQAKILLRNPRNKVYEVGMMLGYSDYSYFYQVYKKYLGYAPGNER